jgi:hypothetical protein
MQVHKLKTLGPYWDAIERGDRTFEVRRNDRCFQKGDLVELIRLSDDLPHRIELNEDWLNPRHVLVRKIKWILTGGRFGIDGEYVVMQLEEAEKPPTDYIIADALWNDLINRKGFDEVASSVPDNVRKAMMHDWARIVRGVMESWTTGKERFRA